MSSTTSFYTLNSIDGVERDLTEFGVSYEIDGKFLFSQVSELVFDQLNVLTSIAIWFELHATLLYVKRIPSHVIFTQKVDVINP